MGYGWIAQEQAEKIQAFYRKTLNVYLNYHRPCGYATEFVDRKGKTRKRYDAYLTPYEKLKRLPQAEQYLRPGVTLAELERIARSHSDTEYALLVHQEKVKLFRSFAPRATVPCGSHLHAHLRMRKDLGSRVLRYSDCGRRSSGGDPRRQGA